MALDESILKYMEYASFIRQKLKDAGLQYSRYSDDINSWTYFTLLTPNKEGVYNEIAKVNVEPDFSSKDYPGKPNTLEITLFDLRYEEAINKLCTEFESKFDRKSKVTMQCG